MLRSRRAGAYIWERVKRLLIPLYTVGLFVLLPPQFYFEVLTHSGYRGHFWHIIPRFLASFRPPRITPWPDTLLPIPFSGHLWFLQYLFLVSLMSLPLLLYLKSGQGQRWVTNLAGWSDRRGGIFLFVIPLSLVLTGLRGLFEAQRSWADLLWYAIFFVIGYIIAADKRFTEAIKRHGWVCLALWQQGLPVVGHVPKKVPLHRALRSGIVSIEHLTGYIDNDLATFLISEEEMEEYARQTREAGVWNCPTLVLFDKVVPPDQFERIERLREMKYMSWRTHFWWRQTLKAVYKNEYQGDDYPQHVTGLMQRMAKARFPVFPFFHFPVSPSSRLPIRSSECYLEPA
jgi:hypothetical protein